MALQTLKDAEARRAYRQELRNVARLLRWSGLVLAFVGTVGIALGGTHHWYSAPSWVCFVIGWALVLTGVVRKAEI